MLQKKEEDMKKKEIKEKLTDKINMAKGNNLAYDEQEQDEEEIQNLE